MQKPLLILAIFVLFDSHLNQVAAQVTSTNTRPLTNINIPQNPIASVTVLAASTEPNVEANALFEEGLKLAEAGQFSQAVDKFQQALKIQPEYADAYAALGRAYFKMREWQLAAGNLRRAIALRTKQREAQNALQQEQSMPRLEQARTSLSATTSAGPHSKQSQKMNANAAGAKASPPSGSKQQPGEVNTSGNAHSANLQSNQPRAANANAVAVKATPPQLRTVQQPKDVNTFGTASRGDPPIKLPQAAKANAAGVKASPTQPGTTPQPQQPKDANIPSNIIPAIPQIKPSQKTNATAVSVKATTSHSETTGQPQQRSASSTPVQASTNPETNLPQPANTNTADLRTPPAESEPTRQPREKAAAVPPSKSEGGNAVEPIREPVGLRVAMNVTPELAPFEIKSVPPTSTDEVSLTKIYRVSPSDVLDIRLTDSQSTQPTLFTVTPSGLLEHPMLTEPLSVTGSTVEEIGTKIEHDLKKRALIDDSKVIVAVRDYASHTILVSGLVKDSGTKFLRREAIPLYVVVADAQPLPEAARVTVVRTDLNQMYEIDLTKTDDMNLLVRPGDVITLHPNATQFIYIGGEVKFPGEKTYRRGLTLTQAINSSGGVSPKSKVANIGRDDGRGFLVGTRFNLEDIRSGKVVDPPLKPGDRIMILRD